MSAYTADDIILTKVLAVFPRVERSTGADGRGFVRTRYAGAFVKTGHGAARIHCTRAGRIDIEDMNES